MTLNDLLILAVLLPMLNAIILPMFSRYQNIRECVIFVFAISTFLICGYVFFLQMLHFQGEFNFAFINKSIYFGLQSNKYNTLFALLVSFLWIVSTIYSIGYMRLHKESNQTRFYSFFSLAIFATLGVAFSANLLTSFLFYEILTISTIPLVAHNANGDNEKISQIKTYIYTLILTSVSLFFVAIILTIGFTGTSDYTEGGIFAKSKINPYIAIGILLLFMFGVAKVALMPFHKWLPSAMVAPTPVSALLHAVAVVKSGAFILFKIFVFIFGISYLQNLVNNLFSFNYLIIIPSITIILASVIALFQNNLKKRLAYSTISQLSYIVLSLCVLTPTSSYASFLHIIAHAFSKIALFFAAGSIIVLSHKENVDELNGIGRSLPITMIAFSIGALSLIGFPLTIGFTSKWFLISGIFDSHNYIPLFVIMLSTLLNAIYFVPIIFKAFFEKPTDNHHTYKKSISMDIALVITSICVVGFNVYSAFLVSLVIN